MKKTLKLKKLFYTIFAADVQPCIEVTCDVIIGNDIDYEWCYWRCLPMHIWWCILLLVRRATSKYGSCFLPCVFCTLLFQCLYD